jgi:hypothetical protein
MSRPKLTWTEPQDRLLILMRQVQFASWETIGARLGLSPETCRAHYYQVVGAELPPIVPRRVARRTPRAELDAKLERARIRNAAYGARSLTASFFGDPPLGYSALDQKRNAGA